MPTLPQSRMKKRFFQSTEYQTIPGGRKKLEYLFSLLVDRMAAGAGTKVLDVGCGNGAVALAVASLGCEVLGVDVNGPSIEQARKVNRFRNARFEVVAEKGFDLKEKFDLIICSEVLEHLFHPQPLVNTMARHLKHDGYLLVTVPNGYGPREVLGRTETFLRRKLRLAALVDKARATAGMIDAAEKCSVHTSNPDQDHVQRFTTSTLKWMIEKAGGRVVEMVNSIFFFSLLLRGKSGLLDKLDGRVADCLPRFMVSGWYVLCQKESDSVEAGGQTTAREEGPC